MEITKNGKVYKVDETDLKWTIKAMDGKVKLVYELPKSDFESVDDVREYFKKLDI